jgi:hypothetical protein
MNVPPGQYASTTERLEMPDRQIPLAPYPFTAAPDSDNRPPDEGALLMWDRA